jgi:large subunit ribosomal protein L25
MEEIRITAERRREKGKGAAKRLRYGGRIPAVLYGRDTEPLPISLSTKEWRSARAHVKSNTVIKIEIKDNESTFERPAMVKEIQRENIGDKVLHIDFLQVSMERVVQVEVPIRIMGAAKGVVEKGGVMEQHMRSVMIESLPGQIPEYIEVDVSDLDIGDSIHVHQISVPGIKFLEPPDVAVVGVTPPQAEEAPVTVAAAATPEVVEEKKEE